MSFEYISNSVTHTERLGALLGGLLAGGDVVCLAGNLGAGKTALTRGIGAGWQANEAVTSPTFTLVHEHRRACDNRVLYHVDCYRLGSVADTHSIGLDDMLFDDGSVVLEWPENVIDSLPPERLWVTFTMLDDDRRKLHISGSGPHHEQLCAALQAALTNEGL